jgi:hypothetical protein
MKKLLIKLLLPFIAKNFPLATYAEIKKFDYVKIKKGRIRELRLYDCIGNRIHNSRIESIVNNLN